MIIEFRLINTPIFLHISISFVFLGFFIQFFSQVHKYLFFILQNISKTTNVFKNRAQNFLSYTKYELF